MFQISYLRLSKYFQYPNFKYSNTQASQLKSQLLNYQLNYLTQPLLLKTKRIRSQTLPPLLSHQTPQLNESFRIPKNSHSNPENSIETLNRSTHTSQQPLPRTTQAPSVQSSQNRRFTRETGKEQDGTRKKVSVPRGASRVAALNSRNAERQATRAGANLNRTCSHSNISEGVKSKTGPLSQDSSKAQFRRVARPALSFSLFLSFFLLFLALPSLTG